MSSLLVLPQAQFFPVSYNLDRCLQSSKSSDIFRYGHFSKSLRHDDQLVHPEFTPKHVGIIMDGNRRWAKARGLPMQEASNNLHFVQEEVDFFMKLYEQLFEEFMRSKLPIKLQKGIELTKEATKGNEGLHLTMALNYGGKYDMLQATKSIASKVKDGLINLEDISNKLFEQELATKTPDLVIRTGGEQRLSNFLLWQLAYSELYFTKTLFPDFGEEAFKETILSFQQRHRRFGGHTY
ncbi:hypothetical protein R3W88_017016 [Solanum pinnatisectum]|uniref:Alkyl transferase n=1 Tax=Solanum pinnatisectum TaxID=50273 RepID=A0AAV9L0A6_9SOLN|nr:hypothetical protein R3W88_017016 [Solanum pinnatisectum]